MSDRKLENTVLWFVCGSLLLILFSLILIMTSSRELIKHLGILKNPSFSGSLAGALLSGLIAASIFFIGEQLARSREKRNMHSKQILNLKRFIYLNKNLIEFIEYFQSDFEGEIFSEEKRYKFQIFIQDIFAIHETLNVVEVSYFDEETALNFLQFQRKAVYLRNEISSLSTLPEIQQIYNISNLVELLKRHKNDLISLEELLQRYIK